MYKYGKGKNSGASTMKYVCATIFQKGKCVSGCIGRFSTACKMCTCESESFVFVFIFLRDFKCMDFREDIVDN